MSDGHGPRYIPLSDWVFMGFVVVVALVALAVLFGQSDDMDPVLREIIRQIRATPTP